MSSRIRILVVDDSAFARKVVRESLEMDPDFEVLDVARDGLEALEKIAALTPDVVTLDLVMPNLDGIGVLRALPRGPGAPRVVAVSTADEASALALEALEAGAIELVHKPTAHATAQLFDLGTELRAKVRVAALAHVPKLAATRSAPPLRVVAPSTRRLVVVGASTGGPQAVTQLLQDLPADFPVPVAIVVHMPVEYTRAFAQRLDEVSPLHVREAEDGIVLAPGIAVIARGGQHLYIDERAGQLVTRVAYEPLASIHRPSVDVLFNSVAALAPSVVGVVLTGMGDDGREGSRLLVSRGATVLTEAQSSCVVYGMPREVKEAGLSTAEAPIAGMAELLVRHV